jgi:hypothetical protein
MDFATKVLFFFENHLVVSKIIPNFAQKAYQYG